jgi:hypothetical protein
MIVKAKEKLVHGDVGGLTCVECGKPLRIATDHGVFCEARHGEKAMKKEMRSLKKLFKRFDSMFDGKVKGFSKPGEL